MKRHRGLLWILALAAVFSASAIFWEWPRGASAAVEDINAPKSTKFPRISRSSVPNPNETRYVASRSAAVVMPEKPTATAIDNSTRPTSPSFQPTATYALSFAYKSDSLSLLSAEVIPITNRPHRADPSWKSSFLSGLPQEVDGLYFETYDVEGHFQTRGITPATDIIFQDVRDADGHLTGGRSKAPRSQVRFYPNVNSATATLVVYCLVQAEGSVPSHPEYRVGKQLAAFDLRTIALK